MADSSRPRPDRPLAPPSGAAESAPEPAPHDVVLVHSPTEDGQGWRVLRSRDGTVEAGALRPVTEGQPLVGELVKLTPRAGAPDDASIFDVEVLYAPPPMRKSGPAQVATDTYRENWEAIFGARESDRALN